MATNVLFLLDSLSPVGGAERVAVKIAISLKNLGNYLPIFCSTRSGGSLEEVLKTNNIDYLLLRRRRFFDVHKFKPLINLIRERNIKIIHSHNLGSNFWGGVIGTIAKVPIIIAHKHGQDYSSWKSLVIDNIVSRLSQKIIFVSNYERKAFINGIGAVSEKCLTIYNGISIDNINPQPKDDMRNKYGVTKRELVVGITARFVPEKDHETFLLAAREVLKTHNDITFLLIGEGKTRPAMEKLSYELRINNRTIFTGFVENIADVLPIIDIGCLTSTREGMGIALLEYMAFLKPIVSTNVGGIPEVVQDGVNGFLVGPGDYTSMADRIITLVDDINLRKQMGEEGFSILRDKFTDSTMTNSIETLYDHTLESAGEV
jgi:glycosyltransferase involved in cell wall biosynthesis